MPRYTFTGDEPAILVGLIQGVNADHVAAPGNPEVPEGSTIVARLGDSIDSRDDDYNCAVLTAESPEPAPVDDVSTAPAPETPVNPYATL